MKPPSLHLHMDVWAVGPISRGQNQAEAPLASISRCRDGSPVSTVLRVLLTYVVRFPHQKDPSCSHSIQVQKLEPCLAQSSAR